MADAMLKSSSADPNPGQEPTSGPESPYLEALLRDGPSTYIRNAHAQMERIRIDDSLLPIVLPQILPDQTHILSPLAHYVRYTKFEVTKRNPVVPGWAFNAAFGSYGRLLRLLGLDRVLYANNWFFTANVDRGFSSPQIRDLTGKLIDRYRHRAIVYSDVNPKLAPSLYQGLLENGYEMTPSRTAYLFDGRDESWRNKRNNKIDQRLLEESPYEIVPNDGIRDDEADLLARLYRQVYILRHTTLNTDLPPEFFKLTLRDPAFHYRALRKDGRIHAYTSWVMCNGIMMSLTLGHDVNAPRRDGLYRQIAAIILAEAARERAMLNLGGGAADFKTWRGAVPSTEFDAVYDRHLSPHRRLAWQLVRLQSRAW